MQSALALSVTGETLTFEVPGRAQTQGSKRAVPIKRTNGSLGVRVVEGDDAEAEERKRAWRTDIREAAKSAIMETGYQLPPPEVPVALMVVVIRRRPSGHLGSGRNAGTVKEAKLGARPTTRPDTLKLVRAIEDALTAVAYHDDSQIVDHRLVKVYADQVGHDPHFEGVWIVVKRALSFAP